jgi:TolB-like protein
MSIFNELKRRNVFRVGIAYLVLGWILLQVTDVVVPILDLPEWVDKLVLFLLLIGLPLVLFFAWAFELTPEGIKRESEVDRSQSITPTTGRKLDFTIIAMLALAVVYLVFDKFSGGEQPVEPVTGELAITTPAEAETTVKSIAVLPFVNMSEDSANEFFSDGISEEILNALAKVKDLKVAGRTSSFAFKGRNDDLRAIGEALGVKHILEGSVRKAGNTVRITAQLIQVDDGFHLWSDTYDRELINVFAIQDEIANAILRELKAELLDEEQAIIASTTTDARAYEQYLLAKQRIYDRNKLSLEAAAQLLDSVIETDPGYAPAYAQRAIVYLLLVEDQYGDISRDIANPAAKDLLDTAIELDPEQAEAWAALGLYWTAQPAGHNQAIEYLEKAVSLNPNLIDASNWLQIAYSNAGQTGKVLPILEGMLERDPLYRPAIGNTIVEYNRLGMEEKSLALIERARPYIPDDAHLLSYESGTLQSLGRYADALPLAEEAVRRQPTDGVFQLTLGFNLWALHEYERLADPQFPTFQRIVALEMTGRDEEAGILAYERAAEGFPGPLLFMMHRAGRYEDLVRYVEERWPDPGAYEEAFPHGSFGYGSMITLAFAYHRTGDEEKYRDALQRVRRAHDQLISENIKNAFFNWQEARYYAVAGDYEKALEQMGIAVEGNQIGLTMRIAQASPAFEPLEGDPHFEALQASMAEDLNGQRAELGLGPATI